MRIESKFAGKCGTCGKPYAKGDLIEWSRESGTHHAACVPDPEAGTIMDMLEAECLADRLGFFKNSSNATSEPVTPPPPPPKAKDSATNRVRKRSLPFPE